MTQKNPCDLVVDKCTDLDLQQSVNTRGTKSVVRNDSGYQPLKWTCYSFSVTCSNLSTKQLNMITALSWLTGNSEKRIFRVQKEKVGI